MYHLHNQFVDVFIHADDVTFLALKYCINSHDRQSLQIVMTYSLIVAKQNVYIFRRPTNIDMKTFDL